MNNNAKKSETIEPRRVTGDEEGCELSLSADKEWLRLVVAGKQVATFHVNYVRKVLGTVDSSKASKSASQKIPAPVLGQDL